MKPINEMFDRMDRWRHLPSYQLERRADILFSLYLPAALETKLGFAIRPELVPEFPVRIGTIFPDDPEKKANLSFKIDYLALSADSCKAVFVELKTEGRSRRTKQDNYLAAAKELGLAALLDGLLSIFQTTGSRPKYFCLLDLLARMGLLRILPRVYDMINQGHLRGISAAVKQTKVVCPVEEHYVVYIQPRGAGTDVISFDEFRRVVERHEDPVSTRFAKSLSEWSTMEAGRRASG